MSQRPRLPNGLKAPLKRVVSHRAARGIMRGTHLYLTLECGHTVLRYHNTEPPQRARCDQCPASYE